MTKQATIHPAFIAEKQGRKFVLYGGLLDSAHDFETLSISTELVQVGTAENDREYICKAYVTTPKGTFTGYGDASPANVSRAMLTCLLRMAETRAKARALRDAINAAGVLLDGDADDDLPEYVPDDSRVQAAGQDTRARANARERVQAEPPIFTDPPRPIQRAEHTDPPAPRPPSAGPSTLPPALATRQQVETIYKLAAQKHGLDDRSTQTDCALRFGGREPDEITTVEAGAYIKQLQLKELSR